MSGQDLRFTRKAIELRQAFDQSFAAAPPDAAARFEDLLAIRVGPDPYAIRLSEVSGLFAGKCVTRMPNAVAEFLGIAGFRGTVVPVYDLRRLLGYVAQDVPRWLLMAAAAPVALAFDLFEGHLRVSHEATAREERVEHAGRHIREILPVGAAGSQSGTEAVRPILDLDSVLDTIKQRG